MKLEELIKKYLPTVNIMQLATSAEGQPWVCTVHYYCDENFNLYWLSNQERRHSREIKQNQKAAAAIVVHQDSPAEDYVIGISVEGVAEFIGDEVEEQAAKGYVEKLSKDPELLSDILSGKGSHKFYRLKPSRIVLFDNKSFPDNPRQEYVVEKTQ